MSATGEAKDARASRAEPRLEERVCECWRRPTLRSGAPGMHARRAHRRARRRAIPHLADAAAQALRIGYKEAEG